MSFLSHASLFLAAIAIVWFFAGLLIESVNNVAKRFHQSGFTVAFFVLGFLTSISEISVMVNASLERSPQVSAGNVVGASLVILLFIVPMLAIVGNGIQLRNTLQKRNLGLALLVILLPVLLLLDGTVSRSDGLLCVLAYGTLLYFIRKQHAGSVKGVVKAVEKELVNSRTATVNDAVKILFGAGFIFLAGHLLVEEAVYFAGYFGVPSSIIGLIALSIGTNIPELVIAIRSILKKRQDIAFGDYLGSTVTNTLIFAFLPFLNGNFHVEPTEFAATAVIMALGFAGFYFAARSKNAISRAEGRWLLVAYAAFFGAQILNLIRLR